MSQERMELWSNDNLTEFAIKFNSIFEVTTSNDPVAMSKIDECPLDLAMNSIGTTLFLNGSFIIWQTNLLLYLTPLYKKSSIFETKIIMKFIVYTMSVLPSRWKVSHLQSHIWNVTFVIWNIIWKKNGSNTKTFGTVIKSSRSIAIPEIAIGNKVSIINWCITILSFQP